MRSILVILAGILKIFALGGGIYFVLLTGILIGIHNPLVQDLLRPSDKVAIGIDLFGIMGIVLIIMGVLIDEKMIRVLLRLPEKEKE
jgi:hypothetical protein